MCCRMACVLWPRGGHVWLRDIVRVCYAFCTLWCSEASHWPHGFVTTIFFLSYLVLLVDLHNVLRHLLLFSLFRWTKLSDLIVRFWIWKKRGDRTLRNRNNDVAADLLSWSKPKDACYSLLTCACRLITRTFAPWSMEFRCELNTLCLSCCIYHA